MLAIFAVSCGGSKDKHITRGEEFLHKRKFQEAAMEFRAAVDIDRDSAAAHWGLARAFENLGQFNDALEELRRATELAPENLEAKTKLGNYYLLMQPPLTAETEKLLEEIFARDANFIEGHVLKASLLAAEGKPEKEVVDVLNQAIAIDPTRTESYLSLARFYMRVNKAKEAETTLQKAVAVNPGRALGYIEYGRFLGFAARANEAEAQFKKATEVDPKDYDAREALAEFYVGQKQFDKAEAAYKELVQVQENSPEARTELANFYVQVGRRDEAVAIFNQILTETPEYVRARYRLGEIYLDQKETAKVTEQIDALLKINDKDSQALLLRARLNLQNNRADDAVRDLEEILKKQPSHRDALFFMTEARLALGQTDQARAFIGDLEKYHPNYLKTRLLKVQAAFADGNADAAYRLANDLYETSKGIVADAGTMAQEIAELRVRALSARGLAGLQLGKLAEAKADLQEVLNSSPKSAGAMVNLAKAFVAEKNPAEALKLYENALAADARNFDALSGVIDLMNRQKQFDRSHARLDDALVKNADRKDLAAALHYLKADTFLAEKNPEAAEAELQKSMDADENYMPAYSSYAALLIARNQTDEAIEQYKKAIEKKPSATLYTLLGMLEEARGNVADAEKDYRKALDIAPETPIAANNLAWLIADGGQGNLDEALRLAQGAVNRHSNVAGYYDTLGWVFFKKGLYSPAVEQLKKAVALDESDAKRTGMKPNPSYRLRLGTALASAGDKSSARREVETSLANEQSLSPKEAQEARTLLASL
ncbi:MAG: tetratricopeptide repeat protein [Acidobacteria bacterium]|nr:tetratricopeptide repeat protein [Acidobacteriota bacterium]